MVGYSFIMKSNFAVPSSLQSCPPPNRGPQTICSWKQMRRGTCLPINYRYPPLITPISTSYAIWSLILSGIRGFQEKQRNKSALLDLVISTKVEKTSTSAPHHAWLLTPLHCKWRRNESPKDETFVCISELVGSHINEKAGSGRSSKSRLQEVILSFTWSWFIWSWFTRYLK